LAGARRTKRGKDEGAGVVNYFGDRGRSIAPVRRRQAAHRVQEGRGRQGVRATLAAPASVAREGCRRVCFPGLGPPE